MQQIIKIANGGNASIADSWVPSHFDSPEILDASDKANPLPNFRDCKVYNTIVRIELVLQSNTQEENQTPWQFIVHKLPSEHGCIRLGSPVRGTCVSETPKIRFDRQNKQNQNDKENWNRVTNFPDENNKRVERNFRNLVEFSCWTAYFENREPHPAMNFGSLNIQSITKIGKRIKMAFSLKLVGPSSRYLARIRFLIRPFWSSSTCPSFCRLNWRTYVHHVKLSIQVDELPLKTGENKLQPYPSDKSADQYGRHQDDHPRSEWQVVVFSI